MKHAYSLATTLLAGLLLAACSQPAAPPPPPAAPTASTPPTDQSFIGRHVGSAIEKARQQLATENIGLTDGIDIQVNGQHWKTGDSKLPKAEITPQGELLILGKPVATTAAQRAELLAYRGQIIGIAEAGMAIGAQGADIAGHALSGAVGAIFGGKDGEEALRTKIEAEATKIEAEALKLCARLPALMAGQQALAASVPEFKPYARMTQDDVDDCGKNVGKDKSSGVTND